MPPDWSSPAVPSRPSSGQSAVWPSWILQNSLSSTSVQTHLVSRPGAPGRQPQTGRGVRHSPAVKMPQSFQQTRVCTVCTPPPAHSPPRRRHVSAQRALLGQWGISVEPEEGHPSTNDDVPQQEVFAPAVPRGKQWLFFIHSIFCNSLTDENYNRYMFKLKIT